MSSEEVRRAELGRERLEELMAEQELSQRALARRINERDFALSDQRRTIEGIIRGERIFSVKSADIIAPALGVSPAYLLGMSDDRLATQNQDWEEGRHEKLALLSYYFPPEPDLIGRDDQLKAVKERLFADSKRNRLALHGIPGVGKSALVLKLVYDSEVQEHFKDGILWAGLGRDGDVLAQLGSWAGKLGISSEALKGLSTIEKRAREIRAAIGEKHMLLVVDDVWKEKAALDFYVGGPRCVHLTTTRSPKVAVKFAGKGGTIPVTELTEDDGLWLLRRWAKKIVDTEPEATREAARELVRAVGCLPLALVLMGKFLEAEEDTGSPRIQWALEQLQRVEARLRHAEPQLPLEQHTSLPEGAYISLEAVIQISEEILDGKARSAFRALSVFPAKPNTFSEEAALAVAAVLNEVVYRLVDAGLLETNGRGRYFLHQTIADYARFERAEEVKAGEADEVVFERMSRFYEDYLKTYRKDYSMVAVEQGNIVSALTWAINSSVTEAATGIGIPFFEFLEARGLYDQANSMTQSVVEVVRKGGDSKRLPLLIRNLGRIERNRGNVDIARKLFLEGLSFAENSGDREAQAVLRKSVGAAYYDVNEYETSKRYFEDGLLLARELCQHENICGLLQNLGAVALQCGNYDQGEVYLREGLALAKEKEHHERAADILSNLASLTAQRGKYAQGEAQYQEGLALAYKLGATELTSVLLAGLGMIALFRGDYSQAEDHFQKGLELARKLGHQDKIGLHLTNLGEVALRRGEYKEAEEHFQNSMTLARKIKNRWLMCSNFVSWGELHLKRSNWGPASASFCKGLGMAKEIGVREFIARALYGISQVAFAQGAVARARRKGQESLAIFEEMGHKDAAEVREWVARLPN